MQQHLRLSCILHLASLVPPRREAEIRPQTFQMALPTSLDARLAVMSVRVVAKLLGALMERLCLTANVAIPDSLSDIDFSSLLTTSSGRQRLAVLLLTTHFPFYLHCVESHRLNAHSIAWSVSHADFLSSIVAHYYLMGLQYHSGHPDLDLRIVKTGTPKWHIARKSFFLATKPMTLCPNCGSCCLLRKSLC